MMAALLVLAGCSAAEPTTETITATVTETEAAEPETVTETVTVTSSPSASSRAKAPSSSSATKASADGDVTDEFMGDHGRQVWSGNVIEVTRAGDSIIVHTAIVDPRGAAGSTEAEIALEVCRAAVETFVPRTVRVLESDDTTFAHAGIDGPECVEY